MFTAFLISALLVNLASPIHAAAEQQSAIATLFSLEGAAERRNSGSALWIACAKGDEFQFGDELRVGDSSRVGIQFADGLFVRLSSKASLRFDQKPSGSSLFLSGGKGHFFNRNSGDNPLIQTNVVSAAVRGTEFVVDAASDLTRISVVEGSVEASNKFGTVLAGAGEQALADGKSAPRKVLLISSADAVQWAAEVPVIFDFQAYRAERADARFIGQIEPLIKHHNFRDALKLSAQHEHAGARLLQADLLLATGQIDRAEGVYSKVSASASPRALAHVNSARALLALAKNDRAAAADLLAKVQDDERASPMFALASSYVEQANKNLEQAREVLRSAVAANPDSALLLVRLAELELAFNEGETAAGLIERALKIDPSEPYALTISGFIKLFAKDTKAAKTLFAKAAQDSGSGLPLLGLGLSKIYEGQLDAGRLEIARAVSLEPGRAVFRSYLGKAFFELENESAAVREYDEAIRLDPLDPTAWLYRGFAQLSRNDLVGALSDVEQSFALNENRAVFRSSLLLDEDLAVRSAGLSRIYNELGFAERGRIEAIQALGRDMSNFSAHSLLGESQQEIFFADASFSERRVADLLAPLSLNLFSSLGGTASLNQYDALFDKSERRTAISLEYDERSDRFASEVSYSGKSDLLGYAMSASADLLDGSKDGNYGRDNRLNGALRYQLAPDHRLLLDLHGSYRDIHDDSAAPQEIRFDRGGGGLGYSYTVDANSTVIAEVTAGRDIARSQEYGQVRPAFSTLITEDSADTVDTELLVDPRLHEYVTAVRGGSQWIYRSEYASMVTGFQLLHESTKRTERSDVIDDALGEFADTGAQIFSRQTADVGGSDFYLYPTWHVTPGLDFTAGVVRSDIKRELVEVTPFVEGTDSEGHWNPKVGITANPFDSFTLRSAYFESLRKSSLEDQVSIEPTIVGGLTQRFNDLSGTKSRNFGFGADYKVASSTYLGGEYIRRYLAEPGTIASSEIISDERTGTIDSDVVIDESFTNHVEQDFARGYVYQVLSKSLVASFDYRYGTEEVTDPDAGSDFLLHRSAAQLKYFHSSGIFTFTRATWRKQQGINNDQLGDDGQEIAWVFDAGVGYRMPNRRGVITLEAFNLADEDFDFDQSQGFEEGFAEGLGLRLVAAINF